MKRSEVFAALAACLLMSGSVVADTFELRDGRSVSGQFIGSSLRSAHLRTSSGVERYPLSDVKTIRLERRADANSHGASARSNGSPPRALIVGQGKSQSIERLRSPN